MFAMILDGGTARATFANRAGNRVSFAAMRAFDDVWGFLFALDGFFFELVVIFFSDSFVTALHVRIITAD